MTSPDSSEHSVVYKAYADFSNLAIEARKARHELQQLKDQETRFNEESTRQTSALARAKQVEAKAYTDVSKSLRDESRALAEHTAGTKRSSEALERAAAQEKVFAEKQKLTNAGLVERLRIQNSLKPLAPQLKSEDTSAEIAASRLKFRTLINLAKEAEKERVSAEKRAAAEIAEIKKQEIAAEKAAQRDMLRTHASALKEDLARTRDSDRASRAEAKADAAEARKDKVTDARIEREIAAERRVREREIHRFNEAMLGDSDKVGKALKRAAIAPKNDWERLIATFLVFRRTLSDSDRDVNRTDGFIKRLSGSIRAAASAGGGGGGISTIFTRIAGAAGDAFGPVSKFSGSLFGFAKLVSAVSAIQPLIAVIGALGGAALGAASSLGSLAGAALALPGLLSAAVGALGGVVVGFHGFSDVLKAVTAEQKASVSGSKQQAAASDQLANAEDSLASAQENVKSSQEGLTRARSDAASKLRDLATGVGRAERALKDAQVESRDAQLALTQARQDAVRQLQDMQAAVTETGDREEAARIRLVRAQQAVDALNESSSALDRREALLALSEAKHNLSDVLRENTRIREEYNEAQKKGIEGSDQVVSAHRGVAQTNQSLADATIAAARASKEYADAQKKGIEGSDQVIQARKELASAIRSTERASRALAATQRSEAGGGSAAESAAQKLKYALDQLSPSARKAAEFFIANKDAIDQVRKTTQEALFQPIVSQLSNLKSLLPVVTDFLSKSAGAMGDVAAKGVAMLASGPWRRDFGEISKNNVGIIHSLGDAALSVVSAFRHIAIAAAPFTQWIADGVKSLADDFDRWAKAGRESGSINRFLDELKPRIKLVGDIFKNLFLFVTRLGSASLDFGDGMLTAIDKVTGRWADWAKSQEEPRSKLKKYFEDIKPLLSALASLVDKFAIGFGKIASDPENIKRSTGLLHQLQTEIFPKLSEIISNLSKSGTLENLITLFGKLLDAVNEFVKSGAAKSLSSFLNTLGVFADELTRLLSIPGAGKILGVIATALGTMAAISFATSGIGLILDKLITVAKFGKSLVGIFTGASGLSKVGVPPGFPPVLPAAGGGAASAGGTAAAGAAGAGGAGLGAALRSGARVAARGIARGGLVGAGVGIVADIIPRFLPGGREGAPQTTGRALGAIATGAATGAAVGSVVPVVGTAVGAGVGAAVGAVYSLIKDKKLRDAVFGFFATIGKDVGRFFASAASDVVDFVKSIPSRVGGFFGGLGKTIGSALANAGKAALDFYKSLPSRILDFLKALPGRIAFLLGQLVGLLIVALVKGLPALIKLWINLYKELGEIAWNGILAIGRFFARLPGMVWNAVKAIVRLFLGLARDIGETAWRAVVSIGRFFARLPGLIWDGIKLIPGLVWSVVKSIGSLFKRSADESAGFFKALPGRIVSFLIGLPGMIWNAIKGIGGFFAKLGINIADGIVSGINFAIGILNKFIGGINSITSKFGITIPDIPPVQGPSSSSPSSAGGGGGGGGRPRSAASGGHLTVADKRAYVPYTHQFAKKYASGGEVGSLDGIDESVQSSGSNSFFASMLRKFIPFVKGKFKDLIAGKISGAASSVGRGIARVARFAAANGGPIQGVGGPTEDNVPIWASVGEFVVNAAATKKHRQLIEEINADKLALGGPVNYASAFANNLVPLPPRISIPRMSSGGSVAAAASSANYSSASNVSFGDTHITINDADDPAKVMRQVNELWNAREKRLARSLHSGRTGWR